MATMTLGDARTVLQNTDCLGFDEASDDLFIAALDTVKRHLPAKLGGPPAFDDFTRLVNYRYSEAKALAT